MSASLSPVSPILISTSMTNYTVATVTAVGFTSIESWDWSLTPLDGAKEDVVEDNFIVTVSGSTLTFDYHSSVGLFPMVYVDYVTPAMSVIRVNDFSELPEPKDSPEISAAIPDPRNIQEWNLTVTVSGQEVVESGGGDGSGGATAPTTQPVTVTQTYLIEIEANFNVMRNRLLEELDKRKRY